jgi:hypothetical protein
MYTYICRALCEETETSLLSPLATAEKAAHQQVAVDIDSEF